MRGISVGGVYTSLQVPELDALFDVGIGLRSFAASPQIFLSHGHADHVGGLVSLLGIRGMMQVPPPRIFLPEPAIDALREGLEAYSQMQRHELEVDLIGVRPGDEHQACAASQVRAFRTHHTVPSVGYQIFRRVQKLREEFRGLPGEEIGRRRRAGEDLFDEVERLELAYATDTLIQVLDTNPELYRSKVLILECTFLDDRKPLSVARAGCHIHLDELIERADLFENEHVVLMHFSQIYAPREVHAILDARLPEPLRSRVRAFAPRSAPWPG